MKHKSSIFQVWQAGLPAGLLGSKPGWVWSLRPDSRFPALAVEVRPPKGTGEKEVVYYKLDLSQPHKVKSQAWVKNAGYWTGIVAVIEGCLVLSEYPQGNLPEASGLMIYGAGGAKIWEDPTGKFLHATDHGIWVERGDGLGREEGFLALPAATFHSEGELAGEPSEGAAPETFRVAERHPLEADWQDYLAGLAGAPVFEDPSYLDMGEAYAFAWTARRPDGLFDQHLAVMQGEDLLEHTLLAEGVERIAPDLMSFMHGWLVAIRGRSELLFWHPGESR